MTRSPRASVTGSAELLAAAATTSPMYRELLAGRDPATLALADLPIVRKPELMRRFHEWVADPAIRLDDCSGSWLTGPGSARPFSVGT